MRCRRKNYRVERCSAALGFEMPQSYSPGDLARTVVQMNRAFVLGRVGRRNPISPAGTGNSLR